MSDESFSDHFDGPDLDTEVWVPHYLPMWSSRAASAASYTVAESELRLTIGEKQPVLLSSSVESRYGATVDATNPELRVNDRIVAPQQTINVQRYMVVRGRLYLRLTLRNFGVERVESGHASDHSAPNS